MPQLNPVSQDLLKLLVSSGVRHRDVTLAEIAGSLGPEWGRGGRRCKGPQGQAHPLLLQPLPLSRTGALKVPWEQIPGPQPEILL